MNKKNKIDKIDLSYIICTCHQVTLEEILYAINTKGANSIDAIAKICDAGSGCGSCVSHKDDINVKKHKIYLEYILKKTKQINKNKHSKDSIKYKD